MTRNDRVSRVGFAAALLSWMRKQETLLVERDDGQRKQSIVLFCNLRASQILHARLFLL